ncbi:acanthoscurrin-2-like [Camellia sinensis]|uniref:acanthoscurrin-2-like n=1 Tax=Camellia sinensis TaxID=4442 RepID=UPI00103672A7|nr:acanthoscurrin-2-like [Camellia sinensis]
MARIQKRPRFLDEGEAEPKAGEGGGGGGGEEEGGGETGGGGTGGGPGIITGEGGGGAKGDGGGAATIAGAATIGGGEATAVAVARRGEQRQSSLPLSPLEGDEEEGKLRGGGVFNSNSNSYGNGAFKSRNLKNREDFLEGESIGEEEEGMV